MSSGSSRPGAPREALWSRAEAAMLRLHPEAEQDDTLTRLRVLEGTSSPAERESLLRRELGSESPSEAELGDALYRLLWEGD